MYLIIIYLWCVYMNVFNDKANRLWMFLTTKTNRPTILEENTVKTTIIENELKYKLFDRTEIVSNKVRFNKTIMHCKWEQVVFYVVIIKCILKDTIKSFIGNCSATFLRMKCNGCNYVRIILFSILMKIVWWILVCL